jgi:iron complex outermembrane receptor protein
VNRDFNFINPKAGITYAKNGWQSFFSYALGHKEPNRDDFQAGVTTQPKPETMHDIETGVEKRTANYHFGATVYYMYYLNQLVLTGQINDVGSYTRTNIPHSYRLGIELQGGAVLNKWMNVSGNLSHSAGTRSHHMLNTLTITIMADRMQHFIKTPTSLFHHR